MTRTGWFIYNGFDTRSLGLTVVPGDIDSAPARNFLVHAHGGANGDFVVDTGRFDNVPRTYTIMIRGNFRATYDALCNALLPMKGYQRLTDMWAPDEYFMAYLSGPLEPTVSPNEDKGTVLVSFTRQPQRWLLSGEQPLSSNRFTVPTAYKCYPTVRTKYWNSRVGWRSELLSLFWLTPEYYSRLVWKMSFNSYSGNVKPASDYFRVNDYLYFDTQTGLVYNETFEKDLTALVDNPIMEGVWPEKHYSPDAAALQITVGYGFDQDTEITPHWYVL